MMNMAVPATVLKAGVHDRLLQDIDHIASMSRVPASMIRTSSKEVLNSAAINYLTAFRGLRAEGTADAYLTGKLKTSPEKVMMGMAAALIRNFIDARVFPLQNIFDEDNAVNPTVLLIPNFQNTFVGKPLASHQLQRLYSILLDRMVQDKVTLIYAENMAQMEKQYGQAIADFIVENYRQLKE
jgi:hypothetical protein